MDMLTVLAAPWLRHAQAANPVKRPHCAESAVAPVLFRLAAAGALLVLLLLALALLAANDYLSRL